MSHFPKSSLRTVVMLVFAACGAATTRPSNAANVPAAVNATMTVADVKAGVERWVRAVEGRDVEAAVACFTPDTVIFDPWPPGRFENSAGARALFNTAMGQMEKPTFTITNPVIRVSGAVGWLTADMVVKAEIATKPGKAKVHLSMVWLKEADGACRMSIFHATVYEAEGIAADRPKLPSPPPMPKPDASGYVPINGIKIYYAIYNAGGRDPMLLLHGSTASGDNWGFQVPALMKSHQVIAIDCRGHGRSTFNDTPFSLHLMAEDVVAVIDHLKLKKVAIVGVSQGAGVGLDLGIHHSDRISRLYLQGGRYSAAGNKPSDPNDPRWAAFRQWAQGEYERLSSTPERFETFFKALGEMPPPNHTAADLARIATPTCVAHPEHDEFVETAHAEEMARLIPGAKFELMHGVGHFVMLQQPEFFNHSVLTFLDGK